MATITPDAPTVTAEATKFSVRGFPLLAEGQTMTLLAEATDLKLHLKVHAPGWNGELVQHVHPREDHAFFVLAGQATFRLQGREPLTVGAFEGIMLPKGVAYSFENSGTENLVIFRAGIATPGSSGLKLLEAAPQDQDVRHVIDHFVPSGAAFAVDAR
jgi:mannose-6-phosphate isomerase-like protein (cupin superfamily)